jgi:hypothetical protein
MTALRIADTLAFPADAVTQTFGILAVRGAGKSNTGAVMAEEMARARLPFVVVDPVGSWWGLRAAGAGQGAGLAIPIFGGRHGDVPLERGAGALLADLAVDQRLSCVLDVSEFSEGDKVRFLTDFAERLYRCNQDPLHLFLEEADDYVPQRPFREQARCLRAWENIVRRGRARGLGITMISQRSAAINKNILTQIETLIVLRTTSPQDRKAIEAWVEYHGQSRELLESLPSLKDGEAWVWSPHWLGALTRIQVRRRETFDSGATPKDVRGKRPPSTLADVDLQAIQTRMAATIEKAKAEDPRELRRQIAVLTAELAREKGKIPAPTAPTIVEVPVLTDTERRSLQEYQKTLAEVRDALDANLSQVHAMLASLVYKTRGAVEAPPRGVPSPRPATPAPTGPRRSPAIPVDGASLSGPEQRILDAVAWIESLGQPDADQAAAAFLAGYTIGGGAWNNPRGRLHSRGLLEYRGGGRLALTDAGRTLARTPQTPLTTVELHQRVLERLPGPECKILRVLLDTYPRPVSNETLAERSGYTDGGGAFNNPRGRLRSLGLIDYPSKGMVVARPILFLEG